MRLAAAALIVATIPLALAPAVRAEPPAAVLEAARREGKVVWYAQPGSRNLLKGPLTTWAKRYPGIAVEIVEAPGPEVSERLKAERRARRQVADVLSSGDVTSYELQALGIYQSYDAASVPNTANLLPRLKTMFAAHRQFLPTTLYTYGLVVNTNVLPEAQWPKSYADAVSPIYKDKIAIHDYSRPGGGATFAFHARQAYGDDYIRKVAALGPRVYGRVQELDASLVRGERAIALPGRTRVPADNPGAPVKFIEPSDGIYAIVISTGIVDGAPQRNAAHVLMDFLLEREVQELYAKLGDGPVVTGIPALVDFEKAKLFSAGSMAQEDLVRYREQMAFSKTVFSR